MCQPWSLERQRVLVWFPWTEDLWVLWLDPFRVPMRLGTGSGQHPQPHCLSSSAPAPSIRWCPLLPCYTSVPVPPLGLASPSPDNLSQHTPPLELGSPWRALLGSHLPPGLQQGVAGLQPSTQVTVEESGKKEQDTVGRKTEKGASEVQKEMGGGCKRDRLPMQGSPRFLPPQLRLCLWESGSKSVV